MNFKEKITYTKKTTIGKAILEDIGNATVITFIIYFCISNININKSFQTLLNNISTGATNALNIALILFPVLIIALIGVRFGNLFLTGQININSTQKKKK